MTSVDQLRELFGLELSHADFNAPKSYDEALAAVAAILADDGIDAHAAWFDRGYDRETRNRETGVHLRLVATGGIITVDQRFSFDVQPNARLIPWSRISELVVYANARGSVTQVEVSNSWVETESGRVEFAGAASPKDHAELVIAVRRHLR